MKTNLAMILISSVLLVGACQAEATELPAATTTQTEEDLPDLPKPEESVRMVDDQDVKTAERHYESRKKRMAWILEEYGHSPAIDDWKASLRDLYDALTGDPDAMAQAELLELQDATKQGLDAALAQAFDQFREELQPVVDEVDVAVEKYEQYFPENTGIVPDRHIMRIYELTDEQKYAQQYLDMDRENITIRKFEGARAKLEKLTAKLDDFIEQGEYLRAKIEAEES